MSKQYNIRYGRMYKVVLAIILPCLLVAPFILILRDLNISEEWQVWGIICAFLALIFSFSVWLVFRLYPHAILEIHKNEISLSFKQSNFLSPPNFSFLVRDILFFESQKIGADEYFLFETKNPYRKFQVSPTTRSIEDLTSFYEAMLEIQKMVKNTQ